MVIITPPNYPINTLVELSGSKSISNRLLILQQIAGQPIHLLNLSSSDDTVLLQEALHLISASDTNTINVQHAGTDMRFLAALLSVTNGNWFLTGSERLKERPVQGLVEALQQLSAEITYCDKEGFPPLQIRGKSLQGGEIAVEASTSSQFVSALLLIAPKLTQGLTLKLQNKPVSKPYVDMTIGLLKQFGVSIKQTSNKIVVPAESSLNMPHSFEIESDWSSASYWYSICALLKGSRIELSHLQQASLQPDSVLAQLYTQLGVTTRFSESGIILTNTTPTCTKFEYDFTHCPDIAQTIAVTCFALGIPAKLQGLQTLRLKETDRIRALYNELTKLGAAVDINGNSLSVNGSPVAKAANVTIETYNDHRMAMSFAPLSILLPGLSIRNELVVNKSYPCFWTDLKNAGFSVNLQP